MRLTLLVASALLVNAEGVLSRPPVSTTGPSSFSRVSQARPEAPRESGIRPSLINYNPVAAIGATVIDSAGGARFTILSDRLIRMEQKSFNATGFEDRATIAMLNRALPVPSFTHSETRGVLRIETASVIVTYIVGSDFSPTTLSVVSRDAASAFDSWAFGDPFPGNLLGTLRGQDMQSHTPLNCTVNKGIDDNGEFNHCEWGIPSRDGWTVYDDSQNFLLDSNDWWVQPPPGWLPTCLTQQPGVDAVAPTRSASYPNGTTVTTAAACCAACESDNTCTAGYVYALTASLTPNCWPLAATNGLVATPNRTFTPTTHYAQNADDVDLYGFFHGHDYSAALLDFTLVAGKTIMVPKYTAGVWNSRWFDYSSQDNIKLVDDYVVRRVGAWRESV